MTDAKKSKAPSLLLSALNAVVAGGMIGVAAGNALLGMAVAALIWMAVFHLTEAYHHD